MRISNLKILKGIPFSQDDKRWITFTSLSEQYNFFSARKVAEFNDLSFVKGFLYKKIKVDIDYDEIILCNYVMFQNEPYSSKWIYAWIKNFEYISDGCTYIEIEIDYFQTYIGKIKFMPCEIDRQHSFDNNFNVLEDTFEEDADAPQPISYVIYDSKNYGSQSNKVKIVYKPNLVIDKMIGSYTILQAISGQDSYNYRNFLGTDYSRYCNAEYVDNLYYSGCATVEYYIRNSTDAQQIIDAMWTLEILGYTIINCFMKPANIPELTETTVDSPINPVYTADKTITGLYTESFTPLNMKSFDSPYWYLEISNHQGIKKQYSYKELNREENKPLHIIGQCINEFEAVMFPEIKNATNLAESIDFSVPIGQNVECYWNNQGSGMLGNIFKFTAGAVGAFLGNPAPLAGATASLATSILTSRDTESNKAYSLPILLASTQNYGWIANTYVCKNITTIDDYFSYYGYKMNCFFDVNVIGRRRWNYVKTKSANIQGDIPIEAKQTITKALNDGITFWHDKNNFDYYSNGSDGRRLYNAKIDRDLTHDYRIFMED